MKVRISLAITGLLMFWIGVAHSQSATGGVAAVPPSPSESSQGPIAPTQNYTVEPAPANARAPIEIGYPLTDLASRCAALSGKTVVVDQSLQGVRLATAVTYGHNSYYCDSFANVLRPQGLTILKQGDVYHVVEGSEKPDIPPRPGSVQ